MLLFSKIATSSVATLGVAGLTLFSAPSLLRENSWIMNLFYKSTTSALNSFDLSFLTKTEQELVNKQLQPWLEKFKKAFEYANNQSSDSKTAVEKAFTEAGELEEKLKKFLETNKSNLVQLGKVSEDLGKFTEDRLRLSSDFQALQNTYGLLKQLNSALTQLATPLSSLVCALNNGTETGGTCSSPSNSSGGGGQSAAGSAGSQAQSTLEIVKKEIEALKTETEDARKKFLGLASQTKVLELALWGEWIKVQSMIGIWTVSAEHWKSQIKKTGNESSKTTTELNEKYKSLREINEKWEEWKRKAAEFYKRRQVFVSSICSKFFKNQSEGSSETCSSSLLGAQGT